MGSLEYPSSTEAVQTGGQGRLAAQKLPGFSTHGHYPDFTVGDEDSGFSHDLRQAENPKAPLVDSCTFTRKLGQKTRQEEGKAEG